MKKTNMDAVKDTVTRKEKFPINRPFTKEQLQAKGEQLAKSLSEKEALEDEKKSFTKKIGADIQAKEAEINILRRHITEKTENILVEGEVVYDGINQEKRFMYQDKVWDVKPLDAADMQRELPLEE